MDSLKVRWGILGAGRIAHTFCKDMTYCHNAELYAIAARSQKSAREFADTYKVGKAYGGYQHLYNDPQVDAIYIATPHNFHYEQCKAALLAGKHILVEKPMTVNAAECAELIELAKKQNCFLMEAMWTVFLPAIIKAKEWVNDGRIGKVVHIKADFGYPVEYIPGDRMYEPELAGGCLLDMGIYPLALTQHFMQEQPLNARYSYRRASTGVEDDLLILAEYDDARASLGTSFRAKLQNSAYITGELGNIEIPSFWRANKCALFELDNKVDEFIDKRLGSGFEFQIEAASEAILQGEQECELMPLSTSLTLQKQIEAIFRGIEDK
jgi:predicted dehydrogenase